MWIIIETNNNGSGVRKRVVLGRETYDIREHQ
jgi:hypothetical protein